MIVASLGLFSLAGCAGSLSGITGASYGCKAPAGTGCQSVSSTYQRAIDQTLPGQVALVGGIVGVSSVSSIAASNNRRDTEPKKTKLSNAESTDVEALNNIEYAAPPTIGYPIRSQPKVMRIWLSPGEDSDGVFHDQRYVYLVVEPGKWQTANALRKFQQNVQPLIEVESMALSRTDIDSRDLQFNTDSKAATNSVVANTVTKPQVAQAVLQPEVTIRIRPVNEVPHPLMPASVSDVATQTFVEPLPLPPTRPKAIIRPLPQPAPTSGGR
jgi:conjugal transfer pilus assembly protein TraV